MKIRNLGQIITGNTPSKNNKEYYESNDICFFKPGDLEEDIINDLYKSEEYISYKAKDTAKLLPKGTILMTCIGTIGKVGILNRDATCNQQINGIIPNGEYNSRYIGYLLLSMKEKLKKKANAPVVPIINKTDFSNIDIFVHNKEKQDLIANKLDKISFLITIKKKNIDNLNKLVKSQFVEMFGSVNDNKNGYEIKALKDVFDFIKDGTHSTPIYTNDINNGVKFLSAKDVTSGVINWNNIKYIPLDLHNELSKRVKPQRNDILLCKNGTTGICAKVDTDEVFDIYVSLALLRPTNDYNVDYLVKAINSIETKKQFDSSLKGIGVPNLHLGEISKVKIIVPPLELQNKFSNIVEQIDKQKFIVMKILSHVSKIRYLC